MLRVIAISALALLSFAASASAAGLPTVESGHRPGPDALYDPAPATPPQLQNVAPWTAEPILVSGVQAYRGGEWIYQDFLYDDHGAAGAPDPNSPNGPSSYLFAPVAGTFTYPTDARYANNAADLVELRVKALAEATAFRVTLNTLKDAARTGVTIAIGGSDSPRAWPHNANTSSPAQLFLTAGGGTVDLIDAASGAAKTPAPTVKVDATRRQVEIVVPHAAWDPGTAKVRMTVGAGLWSPEGKGYVTPEGGSATATAAGGGGPVTASNLWNVGPRLHEPYPDVHMANGGLTIGDAAAGAAVQAAWWRERAQADALRLGDVSSFFADVDFAKLAAGVTDESAVPKTGAIDRILASRYVLGQGSDPTQVCFDLPSNSGKGAKCIGRFLGALQPYAIYVPKKPMPVAGYGMTLLLHSLSANYNQYASSRNQSQLGERDGGSIVITPNGRGPDGFYAGLPEADTFEVWADVSRRYKLDPSWADVSGYSMGGFGTYRLAARYPDLFARAFSVVGIPGTVRDQLASLRNVPLLAWNAAADELVNLRDSEDAVSANQAAGLGFSELLFNDADHLTLATNDEFAPGAEFLGNARVDRDPAHVSYVVDTHEDAANAHAVADHAYWVSGLVPRDAARTASIDVRSDAFGIGDPKPSGLTSSEGVLLGGTHGPMPFTQRTQERRPGAAIPKADRLVVVSANLARATVDAKRARVSCSPVLDLKGEGKLDLTIACAPVKAPSCAGRLRLALPRVRRARVTSVRAFRGKRRLLRVHGRDLRSVSLRRPARSAFTLRLVVRTSKGRRVTVLRRIAACA